MNRLLDVLCIIFVLIIVNVIPSILGIMNYVKVDCFMGGFIFGWAVQLFIVLVVLIAFGINNIAKKL